MPEIKRYIIETLLKETRDDPKLTMAVRLKAAKKLHQNYRIQQISISLCFACCFIAIFAILANLIGQLLMGAIFIVAGNIFWHIEEKNIKENEKKVVKIIKP